MISTCEAISNIISGGTSSICTRIGAQQGVVRVLLQVCGKLFLVRIELRTVFPLTSERVLGKSK